jgi:hypothetical protein
MFERYIVKSVFVGDFIVKIRYRSPEWNSILERLVKSGYGKSVFRKAFQIQFKRYEEDYGTYFNLYYGNRNLIWTTVEAFFSNEEE